MAATVTITRPGTNDAPDQFEAREADVTPELNTRTGSSDVNKYKSSTRAATRVEGSLASFDSLGAVKGLVGGTERRLASPTQAYLAAQRSPYLRRMRMLLVAASASDDLLDRRARVVASRDLLSYIWQHTDLRDDSAAQYFSLLQAALGVKGDLSPAKLRSLVSVVDAVLEGKLSLASRQEARIDLIRLDALPMPEMNDSEGIAFENDEEE